MSAGCFSAGFGRPVDAIEVREADPVRAHGERERRLRVVSSCATMSSMRTARRSDACDRSRVAGAAGLGRTDRLRIDVVAQPQEHRRAQVIVLGPALEAHLGDGLRLDPGRRAH